MSRQRVFNHNRLGKYYWQTANIVDDMGLSPYAFRLYSRLLRVSSIKNVDISTRSLAKACNMSAGKISAAKTELVEAGLIAIDKKTSGRGFAYDEINILDIAQRNLDHCHPEEACSPDELLVSPHERISSPHELIVSPREPLTRNTRKNKTEARKDDGANAPIIITQLAPDADVANATAKPDFDKLAREAGIHNQPAPRKPRKLATNLTVDTTDDERVKAYLRILHQDEITLTNAGMIERRVSDLGLWVATLELWARGNGSTSYNPTNFAGMFENYDRRVIAANTPKTQPLRHSEPLTEPAGFDLLRRMTGGGNVQ